MWWKAGYAMDTRVIDEAIDKYVDERKKRGKKTASERFLTYVYLRHGGDEVLEFLKKVGGLARYYINFLKIMQNPFKGPELAWFASMLTVAIFSCYLMTLDSYRLLGILLFSGTIVHGWSLACEVIKKWLDIGVMIAIYREIVELVDREVRNAA